MRKLFSAIISSTLQRGVRRGILLLALVASVSTTFAHDAKIGGIYYNFDSSTKTASVTYRGSSSSSYEDEYSGSVTIPETVTYNGTTYSVTSIGGGAFADCSSLTSITIPNSVTSIGSSAFVYCFSLTSITIPNSVTSIGSSAFWICGLTSVTIPNSVTKIGYETFYCCSSLTTVTIGENVTSIGEMAFCGCESLTSVTIPNSVTSIEVKAFKDCSSLTTVTIGENVTSIGNNAFYGCSSLTTVFNLSGLNIVKGKNTHGYVAYYASDVYSGYDTVGDFVFAKKDGKDYAVRYLGNDCQITLPANYRGGSYGIGANLFLDNTTANSITISNAVTSIGDYAFNGCSNLNVVYIGNSVISIGEQAFYGCPKLYKVIMLPNSVPTGITSAFQSLSGRITYVGNTNYQSGYSVLGTQRVYTNLNSYFSVDGIIYALVNPSKRTCDIIDCDYSGATTEFYIGKSVVYKNVTLSIDSININAFRNNTKMTKMVVDCNHSLPSNMASGCSSIDTLIITSNVGNIGTNAFSNSSKKSNAFYFINNS